MMTRRVILDTDPGIDDALAILLALASPEVELAAVSVTGGNCSMDAGVRNALAVLALAGRTDVPVCPGVAVPLLRPPYTAPETHGLAGLGYATPPASPVPASHEHAIDMLIREILAHPGEVTLVAVAQLTNVALALRREPRIAHAVREVIVMGGAVRADGNTTSLAEFNFYVDPHAAHIVLESGMPLTILPWDVTSGVMLTGDDVERLLRSPSPITRFIADATRFYLEFHLKAFGYAGCSINDPVALALVFAPELATSVPVHLAIETQSELTMGKTVISYIGSPDGAPDEQDIPAFDTGLRPPAWRKAWRPTPNARVVTACDQRRFIELFCGRIEALVAQGC